MDWNGFDWERLRELRSIFLDARPGGALDSYWERRSDLELYDATFGARIGWKWEAVLRELRLRAITLPLELIVDWGCGSGVAARAVLAASKPEAACRVQLWDRSRLAMDFAAERLRAEHPGLDVRSGPVNAELRPALVLVSHALNELAEHDLDQLIELLRRAASFVWVESGDLQTSRKLSAVRDRLLDTLQVLAPCTHQAACGVLALEQGSNWCHHFAKPPPEVYQSRNWALFGRELEIDLRSLPYSFLVMRRAAADAPQANADERIIGRPRQLKGHAKIQSCGASGVRELTFLQRKDRALFKSLQDTAGELLIYRWQLSLHSIEAGEARYR